MDKIDNRVNVSEEKIELYGLGIDLSNDYTQVSYMGAADKEPVSLSTLKGEKRYLIPTVLYKKREINEWCLGDEANQRSYDDSDDSQAIRNILGIFYSDDSVTIEGVEYSAKDVLTIYIQELMKYVKRLLKADKIHYISITVEKVDEKLFSAIYDAVKKTGISREFIRVISHSEAFIYYTINQDKAVWVNDVALFDFNDEHFVYKRFNVIKNKKPNIIKVTEIDISQLINTEMLYDEEGRQRADYKFYEFIVDEFKKHIASAAYLTGTGFYKEWINKSLNELCSKRKVFKGYNLLVKGACYAAMKKYNKIETVDHIFQCEGRTSSNIGLMVEHNGKNVVMMLSKAGTNWYDAGAKVECIVDNIEKIQFVFNPILSNVSKNVMLDLSPLPIRNDKTTRIQISIAYKNSNTCEIEIRDIGFGDFVKATDTVIRETVNIENQIL